MNDQRDQGLICHRCGCDLHPGKGNFYVVKIEAFADPTPPDLSETDGWSDLDINGEISRLLEQMKDSSSQQLMDQVHRRLTIHLCGTCYRKWIENPAGL